MMTTYDFGAGPVPAHQHSNGGGWVADAATVSDAVFVGPQARVASGTIEGGIIRGGTLRGGTLRGGIIRGGTILGGTIEGGTILGGTIEGGTILGGTLRGGIIRGGTIWGGTIERGTIWGGTIWGGSVVKVTPPSAGRSDGYMFLVLAQEDGTVRVTAGCHNFTFDEARAHWSATRGGTPLGDETFRILAFLEAQYAARKGGG